MLARSSSDNPSRRQSFVNPFISMKVRRSSGLNQCLGYSTVNFPVFPRPTTACILHKEEMILGAVPWLFLVAYYPSGWDSQDDSVIFSVFPSIGLELLS